MRKIYTVLAVIFISIPFFAQERLTLAHCIELAKMCNKRVVAADYRIKSSIYARKAAFANYLPRISFDGLGLCSTVDGRLDVDGGLLPVLGADGIPTGAGAYFPGLGIDYGTGCLYGVGVKVEQPLFMGGKIVAGYKIGQIGELIANQSYRMNEADVVVETALAFANVVRADEMRKVAASYNELLKELLRSVQMANKRGVKSRNDVLKVEVRLRESELNLQRANNGRHIAAMSLCHLIGLPLDRVIEVEEELPKNDYSIAAINDISARPDAAILALKRDILHQKVNIARSDLLPQLVLVGVCGYMNGPIIGNDRALGGWNAMLGLKLSVPLFNASSYAKLRMAKMQYRETIADEENSTELMMLEAAKAANTLSESALELSIAEGGVVSATENLRVCNRLFQVGNIPLTDYLEAQTMWLQAHQKLIEARINRFLYRLEYLRAIGAIL